MPSCTFQMQVFLYFKIMSLFFNGFPDLKIYFNVFKINF